MRTAPPDSLPIPRPGIPPRSIVHIQHGRRHLFGVPSDVVRELQAMGPFDGDVDLAGYLERVDTRLRGHGQPGLPAGTVEERSRAALMALERLGAFTVGLPLDVGC